MLWDFGAVRHPGLRCPQPYTLQKRDECENDVCESDVCENDCHPMTIMISSLTKHVSTPQLATCQRHYLQKQICKICTGMLCILLILKNTKTLHCFAAARERVFWSFYSFHGSLPTEINMPNARVTPGYSRDTLYQKPLTCPGGGCTRSL